MQTLKTSNFEPSKAEVEQLNIVIEFPCLLGLTVLCIFMLQLRRMEDLRHVSASATIYLYLGLDTAEADGRPPPCIGICYYISIFRIGYS